MSLEPDGSTLRSFLDLTSRHNNRLLDQQLLARARQIDAEQELLQRNRLLISTQRQLEYQQVVSAALRQSHINNSHLDELARLQESQYLQQISHHGGGSQPVLLYVPNTSLVQPPFPRAVSASQPADILDLTIEDDEEEDEAEKQRKNEVDKNHYASPSQDRTPLSESASRKRKLDKVSPATNTTGRKLPVSHNSSTGASDVKPPPTERQVPLPSDYVPPKCVQTKDVSVLTKVLLGQIDLADVEESSSLRGPLIVTPSMLKKIATRTASQAKKLYKSTKDKEIAKLQSQLEATKKKAVTKADVEQIKKECAREVEEVRRQSQLAMQAYMKATVNAFERLEHAKDDSDD